MLAQQVERAHGADALDVVGVVAAAQHAQVDKLLVAEAELGQRGGAVKLADRLHVAAALRRHQVADDLGRAKREAVHVLGRDAVHEPLLGHDGALRLGLGRRVDDRHAHEAQQALALVVVRRRHLDRALAVLLDRLGVARLARRRQALGRAVAALAALGELVELELRRLAVKDKDGADAFFVFLFCFGFGLGVFRGVKRGSCVVSAAGSRTPYVRAPPPPPPHDAAIACIACFCPSHSRNDTRTGLQHLGRAEKHADEVARHVARLVGQHLLALAADDDQELIWVGGVV